MASAHPFHPTARGTPHAQTFNYGVYGVGRIGKVHANIVARKDSVVALGDDVSTAVVAAKANSPPQTCRHSPIRRHGPRHDRST
ncbi:MAG: hypothetical protein R2856_13585 [Caldilineaceae bacterium]